MISSVIANQKHPRFTMLLAGALLLCASPAALACEEEAGPELSALAIARQVKARQPSGVGSEVPADGKRVYVHMTFYNPEQDAQVDVHVLRNGKPFYSTTVNVGESQSWRTWIYLSASQSMIGDYEVRVFDAAHEYEMARETFTIESQTSYARRQAARALAQVTPPAK